LNFNANWGAIENPNHFFFFLTTHYFFDFEWLTVNEWMNESINRIFPPRRWRRRLLTISTTPSIYKR
jgi:hypothetical protein